jgi:hypothetical protein
VLLEGPVISPVFREETCMAGTTRSKPPGSGGKGGKKGGGSVSLKSTDIIPVWLDVATARSLALAISLALGKPVNPKKMGGGGKGGGKGGKGGGGKGGRAKSGGSRKGAA